MFVSRSTSDTSVATGAPSAAKRGYALALETTNAPTVQDTRRKQIKWGYRAPSDQLREAGGDLRQ